ncbi:unnamed protein product [Plutella xylostella]|uniref:(diamondback moth) hypothetical protein n=1 Tax=Plutella xylostella TaxID=51655 RepID=A0A8S4DIP7_PLUXY|nr:unnamed protein product [Plutella xylostella]
MSADHTSGGRRRQNIPIFVVTRSRFQFPIRSHYHTARALAATADNAVGGNIAPKFRTRLTGKWKKARKARDPESVVCAATPPARAQHLSHSAAGRADLLYDASRPEAIRSTTGARPHRIDMLRFNQLANRNAVHDPLGKEASSPQGVKEAVGERGEGTPPSPASRASPSPAPDERDDIEHSIPATLIQDPNVER